MIDEKTIEGLREYLKDHYIPPDDGLSVTTSTSTSFSISHSITEGSDTRVHCILDRAEKFEADEISCRFDKRPTFREVSDEVADYIKEHRKPGGFAHTLDRLRSERGLNPAELYKRANIDRRQYSRFMGPEGRHPSMNTVISFALALRLNRAEFDEFLQTAGYSLSNASTRDVCIMYCLEKGIYDIDEVNALLFEIGIDPLSRE